MLTFSAICAATNRSVDETAPVLCERAAAGAMEERGSPAEKYNTLTYRVTVLILMWRYSREIESKRRSTTKHDQEEESQPTVLRHLQIPAGFCYLSRERPQSDDC